MEQPYQLLAERIISDALKKESVAEGFYRLYDAIIAWAEEVSLKAVVAYNAKRLDATRSQEAIQEYPAEAYLAYWGQEKLRAGLVTAVNERVMDTAYQPGDFSIPPNEQGILSDAEIREIAKTVAAYLTIETGIDFFINTIARFASLVDHEMVNQQAVDFNRDWAALKDEDFFMEAMQILFYAVIEPMAERGVPIEVKNHRAEEGMEHFSHRSSSGAMWVSDSPHELFNKSLAPEVWKAYREAGCALIHYLIVKEQMKVPAMRYGRAHSDFPELLNDFESLSLTEDGGRWTLPIRDNQSSLWVTSFLVLAGTAAPSFFLDVMVNPMRDESPNGQAVLKMLQDLESHTEFPDDEALSDIIYLYQCAYDEVKKNWNAVEQLANQLLEQGRLTKDEAYQILAESRKK